MPLWVIFMRMGAAVQSGDLCAVASPSLLVSIFLADASDSSDAKPSLWHLILRLSRTVEGQSLVDCVEASPVDKKLVGSLCIS